MEMTENKALELIENMIASAKREIQDNGYIHMIWGYLVFISALVDYFLLMNDNPNHAVIWAITMPGGGIFSLIKGRLDSKKQKVVTYIDDVLNVLVIAFTVSLLIVCLIMPMTQKNWQSFFPTLMVIYAFGLYTMGGIIKFKPMQYGAFAIWTLSCIGYFYTYDVQLLLLALGVLAGFIIPGHILNFRYRKHV